MGWKDQLVAVALSCATIFAGASGCDENGNLRPRRGRIRALSPEEQRRMDEAAKKIIDDEEKRPRIKIEQPPTPPPRKNITAPSTDPQP